MKNSWIFYLLILINFVVFQSCDGDEKVGSSILTEEDEIVVKSATFKMQSGLNLYPEVSFYPDSFLLGECDTHFGTIRADLLTQFACPKGFAYPDSVEDAHGKKIFTQLTVDSVSLSLYYRNWYGDGYAPLGITVYQMDGQTLSDNDTTLSNYCSLVDSTHIVSSPVVFVPATPNDSSYSTEYEAYVPTIHIKLSDEFAQRFFSIKKFTTQKEFNELFKGLYICSDFGGSSVLYINDITMTVHYHFTLPRPGVEDSVIYDTKSFYANNEVRQLNRYLYYEQEKVLEDLKEREDTNYIISPANIYTWLSIDMNSIKNSIDTELNNGNESLYRVYVNRANLTVDVLYSDSLTERPRDNWDSPANNMILIKEEELSSFLTENKLPSDTSAIIASLVGSTDNLNQTSYSYSYDLSSLLTAELRATDMKGELKFALIPVAVKSNLSTGQVISVKPQQTITVTRIRSANNSTPMNLDMVYSGFRLVQ